jgi:hypothetical protein
MREFLVKSNYMVYQHQVHTTGCLDHSISNKKQNYLISKSMKSSKSIYKIIDLSGVTTLAKIMSTLIYKVLSITESNTTLI